VAGVPCSVRDPGPPSARGRFFGTGLAGLCMWKSHTGSYSALGAPSREALDFGKLLELLVYKGRKQNKKVPRQI
jgi:hypothetical protein